MYVIIIGAGTIGSSTAEFLHKSGFDVTVIDRNKEPLERLSSVLDIQTLQGEGCDPGVLLQANVSMADLVMAMSSNEEANLVSTAAARKLGANRAIARVRSAYYLNPIIYDHRNALGVDMVISPELMTAGEIIKFLDNPDALALEFYAKGKAQLQQLVIEESHPYCDRPLKHLNLPANVLVVLISREGHPIIPNGDSRIQPGDKVTLLGKSQTLIGMKEITHPKTESLRTVAIAGGGTIGRFVAKGLESRKRTIKLLEADAERCRWLGEYLDNINILHGDATRRSFLLDERIGQTDVFIAAMRNDEDNIMAALLAKKLGAGKCVAILKRPDYSDLLLENTSIDLALSPREVTAERVMTVVKRGLINNISLLEDGKAEIIEFTARASAKILNKPLMELKFPEGSLVGMINHGNNIHIPRGTDTIKEGDSVIMVALAEVAEKVEKLFG